MNNLYKNDLKQLKNVFVIYSGFILLDLVLYFISYQDDFPVTMLKAIVFIASIIVPAFNLRYLFDSGNYSQYLSLPITKKQSFIIKYLSGLTVLLLPLVFYSLIALIFDLHNFGNVLIILLMIIGIYYSLGNLTAYSTTSIIMNICLQVIVFVAPIIIFICIFAVYQTFIRGIIITALPDTVLDLLIPIYSLMKAGIESVAINEILICIFYSLAFTICGFLACLKINSLTNYHGFTNHVIAQIIKMVIIVVISWMFTGLTDVPSMSISVLFAISIIATFMTVFLIQYIYTKKIKYKANILQASIISIITLGLFLGGKSFVEDYIPGNIESVTINHDIQFALSKNLLNKNAYLKDKFGTPYEDAPSINSLHTSMFANSYNTYMKKYSFKLLNNPVAKTILIGVFDLNTKELLDCSVGYTYQDIQKALTKKLKNLLYVTAQTKKEGGKELFYFNKADIYTEPSFERFISLLTDGKIMYDIRIGSYKSGPKYGMPHDHGSGFRILEANIRLLYSDHETIE